VLVPERERYTIRRMDRPHIFVSDLRLAARVGVNPGEDETSQTVVLDIWVGAEDFEKAAASARLGDTVDYVGIARAARKVVTARHYPLVETLATRVAEAVLSRPGASWVRVRLQKLSCLRHASAAGVEVELRSRPAAAHPEPAPLASQGEQEIVIVGGGAAGMAAALWCHRLGHPALVIDAAEQLGGQLHLVHGQMRDLPAMEPMTGARLAGRLWRQFAAHGGRWCRARLEQLAPAEEDLRLTLKEQGRQELVARALILCTGVRRRELGVPGERELLGRGLLHTAARDTASLRGRRVVVVGGGDSACENALILADHGARVTLVHRRGQLTAQAQFQERIEASAAIDLQLDTRVLSFRGSGSDRLEAVELSGPDGSRMLPAEAALVRVGWLPQSEALQPGWLDPNGFVRADPEGRVRGERRVFAAGDLLGRMAPSVATAFGSAATAARAVVHLLEVG